jgi:hypothetical protein
MYDPERTRTIFGHVLASLSSIFLNKQPCPYAGDGKSWQCHYGEPTGCRTARNGHTRRANEENRGTCLPEHFAPRLSMHTIPRRHSIPDTQESPTSASCTVLLRATLDPGIIVSFANTGVVLSGSPAACEEDGRVSGWARRAPAQKKNNNAPVGRLERLHRSRKFGM